MRIGRELQKIAEDVNAAAKRAVVANKAAKEAVKTESELGWKSHKAAADVRRMGASRRGPSLRREAAADKAKFKGQAHAADMLKRGQDTLAGASLRTTAKAALKRIPRDKVMMTTE